MTPKDKLIADIDHAVHQRSVLEDSNFDKEVHASLDRYLAAQYGVRLQPMQELGRWQERYVSMRGKLIDHEDKQRGGL